MCSDVGGIGALVALTLVQQIERERERGRERQTERESESQREKEVSTPSPRSSLSPAGWSYRYIYIYIYLAGVWSLINFVVFITIFSFFVLGAFGGNVFSPKGWRNKLPNL